MLRSPATAAVALCLLPALACVSTSRSRPLSGPQGPGAPAAVMTRQSLYRLTFDGGEGRTTLKVVLREAANGRFQMVFSDLAGRRVWALDHAPGRSILVDHRQAIYCVSGDELALPEVHPDELPLAAIPRVLAGRLPVPRPPDRGEPEGHEEFVDGAGRTWRAAREGGELVSWTLLDGNGPSLWWRPDRAGGILSRRSGEQYRWTLVVAEPSSAPLPDVVPPGYSEGTCGG